MAKALRYRKFFEKEVGQVKFLGGLSASLDDFLKSLVRISESFEVVYGHSGDYDMIRRNLKDVTEKAKTLGFRVEVKNEMTIVFHFDENKEK